MLPEPLAVARVLARATTNGQAGLEAGLKAGLEAGWHLGQDLGWDGGQGSSHDHCHSMAAVPPLCLAYQLQQSLGLLPHPTSQSQSQPRCWPASRHGNCAYTFAVTLAVTSGSGNVSGRNMNTGYMLFCG